MFSCDWTTELSSLESEKGSKSLSSWSYGVLRRSFKGSRFRGVEGKGFIKAENSLFNLLNSFSWNESDTKRKLWARYFDCLLLSLLHPLIKECKLYFFITFKFFTIIWFIGYGASFGWGRGFSLFFSSNLATRNPDIVLMNLEAFLIFSAFSFSLTIYSVESNLPLGPLT